MDSEELSRWIAYDQLDRIDDHYWIGAQICQVLAQVMTGKPYKVEDFIPRRRRPRIVSGEAGLAWFGGIAAAQNAKAKAELQAKYWPLSVGSKSGLRPTRAGS